MEDLLHHKAVSENGNSKGFRKSALLLSSLIVTGAIAQNVKDLFDTNTSSGWLATLAGLSIFFIFAAVFFRHFYKVIDTPHFTVSGLLGIALGTAIGTFITQNAPPELFTQRYGETGSKFLRFGHLDELFHSWWYVSLFVVLASGLVKISLKKKISRENIGFHMAHLAPALILFGFWIDHFYGFRGIIQLEVGESKNTVRLYDRHTNYLTDSTVLPFRIRLDHFEYEKHAPDYRIQVWRKDTSVHAQYTGMGGMTHEKEPEILASFPLEKMKIRRIYGTNLRFRLAEIYRNFHFKYTYPEVADTIEAKAPGIMLELKTPAGDAVVQLRDDQPGRNKLADLEALGAWLEFYWELPDDVFAKLTKMPPATAGPEHNRIVFAGKKRLIYYSINGKLTTQNLVANQPLPLPNRDSATFSVLHVFPDASLLQAIPASKDEQWLNPVAKVEVWDKSWKHSQEAYIYPGMGKRKSGLFEIPGSPYFLAFESIKDRETKFYKSELSVLGPDGEVLQQQSVEVNEFMLHGGYRFYQTDYDPNRPNYSGIGVTHEPGLYLIYFGFFVLVCGCALMFYGRAAKTAALN